jgi:hypothetical protein
MVLALWGVAQAQETEGVQTEVDPNQNVDLLISNETLEGRYHRDIGLIGTGTQELLLGGYINTDNSFQFTAGLSTEVLKGFTPLGDNLKFSLGSRFYISRLADPTNNVSGLGFGAGWDFAFPQKILKLPLSVRGSYYYSPEVLTSGNDQDILDFDIVEVQLDVSKNLAAIFGIREMSVANRDLDNNWHLGVRYGW